MSDYFFEFLLQHTVNTSPFFIRKFRKFHFAHLEKFCKTILMPHIFSAWRTCEILWTTMLLLRSATSWNISYISLGFNRAQWRERFFNNLWIEFLYTFASPTFSSFIRAFISIHYTSLTVSDDTTYKIVYLWCDDSVSCSWTHINESE